MNAKTQLILHSNHLLIRTGLDAVLQGEEDLEVVAQTGCVQELLNRVVQLRPQVLLLGIAAEDGGIQRLIRQIKAEAPETAVLVVSLCEDDHFAAVCIGAGAALFLSRCPEAPELKNTIRRLTTDTSGRESAVGWPADGAVPSAFEHTLLETGDARAMQASGSHTAGTIPDSHAQKPESQRMLAPLTWAMDKLAHELNFLTAHDALTGLVNRREFERRLKGAVRDAKVTGTGHALLYLDLDQFKLINDTCGHMAGDDYLRQVSELLSQHVRTSDTLARLGGDEFALLLYGCAAQPATRIAEQLRQVIAELEFGWLHRKFGGSVSIGVVTFAEDALNAEQVLSVADSACFLAKEKGRNRVHLYRPDDAELSARLQEMDWVSRLRQALDQKRLMLYAQDIIPIAEQDNGQTRVEILVRLQDVDGQIVQPSAFIPAAERYNLMPTVDRYIISTAFQHLAGLNAHQQKNCCYSINVSGATLNEETFPAFVEQQLAEHCLSASQICFEVTETAAIANLLQVADVIRTLKLQGFQFALDDFGRGMSSLAYLKHLPVDFIKIDGEFIKGILKDEVDGAMVRAIAGIARTMGIKTVAEFVENDAVFDLLETLGVDFAQGYGIHKPQPLKERLVSSAHALAVGAEQG